MVAQAILNAASRNVAFVSIFLGCSISQQSSFATEPDLEQLLQTFQDHTGARLVFERDDLPGGRYHDVLKPLDQGRRERAVKICLDEAKYYPRGYFGRVGLTAIGVFEACASKTTTDPSRAFDRQLGGYRYFGIYNKRDAIAAAFHSDGQLGLTFHHEIFHHVDSTVAGDTAAWQLSGDDALYQAAISGRRPYVAPPIRPIDLQLLRKKCIGFTLTDSVSAYAAKNLREDQAETARHLMSMLPNSLVQSIEQPQLAGSQRILHILGEYEKSVPDGPDFDWFVDVALGRTPEEFLDLSAEDLIIRLQRFAGAQENNVVANAAEVRQLLKDVIRCSANELSQQQAATLRALSAKLTVKLMRGRIQPDTNDRTFSIWGREDADGANHTLRHDLITFGRDAKRLAWIAEIHAPSASNFESDVATQAVLVNIQLLARYYNFIAREFSLSGGTSDVFDSSRSMMLTSLPQSKTRSRWQTASWDEAAQMSD